MGMGRKEREGEKEREREISCFPHRKWEQRFKMVVPIPSLVLES
jgi:hypothetical protein